MKKIKILLIGRFDSVTGIGWHGWSLLHALSNCENYELSIFFTQSEKIDKNTFNSFKEIKIYDSTSSLPNTFDVSIYCDVLSNYPGDNTWNLSQAGKIRCAYVVFDSDEIPDEWIEILNFNFDIAITPSEFVRKSCINSAVLIPIYTIPLLVETKEDTKEYKNIFIAVKTFGFIGGFEERKNIDLLIKAFKKAFLNNKEIKLKIHISTDAVITEFILSHAYSQVEISQGLLSKTSYQNLIQEIDCFVSVSKGEGFSIIPREFLIRGKPVLLSYTSAHKELTELNNVFFIEAPVASPAYYPHIDKNFHGVQYSPYMQDVVYALKQIAQGINLSYSLEDKEKINNLWSRKAIAEQLKLLFSPHAITTGQTFQVTNDCLIISNPTLLKKYIDIHDNLIVKEKSLEIVKHTVLMNDAGFFSIFNKFISILVWETSIDNTILVIPDWRVESLIKLKSHEKFTSFCYGKVSDGNIYLKLFKPLAFDNITEDYYNNDDWLYNNSIIRTDYNEKYEPNLTYIHAYKLYKSSNFQQTRQNYHTVIEKHIHLREHLQIIIDNFSKTYFDGNYIIAAHVRHPSHSMEQPGGRMPSVELFQSYIDKEISKAEAEQLLPVKIFIATDQESVVEYFHNIYKDKLIIMDATRTTIQQEEIYHSLDKKEKNQEGFQIQHIMAADKEKNSLKMAEEVIIDAWLLAKSNVFIHITSNIATAVSFLNPSIHMIYCE